MPAVRRSLTEKILLLRRRALMAFRRLRFRLRHVHRTAYIASQVRVCPDLVMGEYSFVNSHSWICSQVEIRRYAMLGPYVKVIGGDHRFEVAGVPTIFAGRPPQVKTVIGEDAWIGCGAIVIAGVRIGRGAIVAAGSVVTSDVPDYEIHAGVPNRKLRDRFSSAEERSRHEAMLRGPVIDGHFCPPESMANPDSPGKEAERS